MLRITVELPAGYVSEAKEGKKDLSREIWKNLCDLYGLRGGTAPDIVCRILNESLGSSSVRACNADVILTLQCIEGDIGTPELRLKVTDCLKDAVCAITGVSKEKVAVFLTEINAGKFSINGILVCDRNS